jgi:hypothetical protein
MKTMSTLLIAAGMLGTIAGAGVTSAAAQGVYVEGPRFWSWYRPTCVS